MKKMLIILSVLLGIVGVGFAIYHVSEGFGTANVYEEPAEGGF